jgi:hypothetical protein
MESVLRLYAGPPTQGVVRLCVDERPCQLVDEVMSPLAAKPGKVRKVDYEYKRQGTCCMFIAYDLDRGWRYTEVRKQRTKKDYAAFIDRLLSTYYMDAKKVKLVQDNLNTHTKGSFYEHLSVGRAGALSALIDFVYTPKHGSWLNMAEIELSALSRQCLEGRIGTVEELQKQTGLWTGRRNRQAVKISWSFSVEAAREKLNRSYQQVNQQN